jgi:hypothetical protein
MVGPHRIGQRQQQEHQAEATLAQGVGDLADRNPLGRRPVRPAANRPRTAEMLAEGVSGASAGGWSMVDPALTKRRYPYRKAAGGGRPAPAKSARLRPF